MSAPDDNDWAVPSTANAFDAAVAVAREHGVNARDPRLLSETNNVLVALDPAPVVARVARMLAPIRDGGGGEQLRREVELASYVHSRGGPVVPPSAELPPGPHGRDGFWITFWTEAEGESRASFDEAAPSLRELHRLIENFPGSLRHLAPVLDDAPPMLAAALAGGAIAEDEVAMVLRRLEVVTSAITDPALRHRPLHGDAHAANLLLLDGQLAWNDLEDACLGPVEWDLVCLLRSREDVTREELTAYDPDFDPDRLIPFIEARMIEAAAWRAYLSRTDPDRYRQRDESLAWLAERDLTASSR